MPAALRTTPAYRLAPPARRLQRMAQRGEVEQIVSAHGVTPTDTAILDELGEEHMRTGKVIV